MMKAQFDAAETALLEFERSNSNHEFSSRARFLRAKARLGAGDLERAASLFQETIDQFPGSEEADKARFKLALISLLQNDVPAAKQRFQQIVDRSDSVYVPEAIAMLAMLKRQANE